MLSGLRHLRSRRLTPLIAEEAEFYGRQSGPSEIRAWQLKRFNEEWESIRRDVPFFADLCARERLPDAFASWEEFRERVPVMDRKTLQTRGAALRSRTRPPDSTRTTGGSTGEPVQLSVWNSEAEYSSRDMWLARGWFGVSPSDPLFMIWGHSHLLGHGFRGRMNALKREGKDALLGYCRVSAYDLSEPALRRAGERMLAFRPQFVLAYAVALDRFARANSDRREMFHRLGIKVAIATAESFPREDCARSASDVLGCPVAMEYGSVETGVLAHQKPNGRFAVLWRHYFVEGQESCTVPGAYEILVTSLYPRCCPLIRYRIGDLISEDPNAVAFDQTFDRVIGRCNDCIALSDGVSIHSEAFTHAIKECPFVLSFQVMQDDQGAIQFRYVSSDIQIVDEHEILRRLEAIHPALRDVNLRRVSSLPQTIAGKTRSIVRE